MKLKLRLLTCLRCGHVWTPRKQIVMQCPKCKSAYWDTAKEATG